MNIRAMKNRLSGRFETARENLLSSRSHHLRKRTSVLLFFTFLICVACDSAEKQSNEAVKELNSQLDKLSTTVSEFVKSAEVPEEVKKLQQFEYKVVALPATLTAEDIQQKLAELGKERWDCFFVDRAQPETLTFYFKRRPDTPLKYVPRGIWGAGL
jgi:hypothetical protein